MTPARRRPTPILLKYGCGGFNALHRDLRGAVFFPIQMAVVLSPRADLDDVDAQGFQGRRVPVLRRSREKKVAPPGSRARPRRRGAVLHSRPISFATGGVVGLQPVKHGAAAITSGTRFVLGVPFHEYR